MTDRSVLSVLPPDRHTIRDVLLAYAIDSVENQGLHAWRCRYPEFYGACSCFEDLVDDLSRVDALAAAQSALRDIGLRVDREVREGYMSVSLGGVLIRKVEAAGVPIPEAEAPV
jgi:hypothetical protein